MTRRDREDLWDRLESLESAYGLASEADGVLIAAPIGGDGDGDSDGDEAAPVGVAVDAITTERERDDETIVEQLVIPRYRPPVYRNGVTVASYREIRALWADMPADVRERELEMRIEKGLPIPPLLQE